jgi:hypothetical protein
MENMKKNLLLIPFIAVLSFLMVSLVSAGDLAGTVETDFNNVELDVFSVTMSGMVGDVVPLRVTFDAIQDMSDVKVKARIEGHRDDVYASTERFDIVASTTYTKLLSLQLPSDEDDQYKDYTLYVEIVSSTDRTEREYTIRMQRESYTFEILSVDNPSKMSTGDVVPVSVVVKNNGFNRADDTYVVVSIPSLGISSQKYLGDLVTTSIDNSQGNDEDDTDSISATVYLEIPEDSNGGVYLMEIRTYNDDSSFAVEKLVSVEDSNNFEVLTAVKNKDLNAGESTTYELIIVNSASGVRVFNINTVFGNGLTVSVPSVITVGSESSETVEIVVTASEDAAIGTYTFSVEVDEEQAVFGANIIGSSVSASVVALTIILVIIFVVLLAVLVTLLARKEKPMEEVETSYY